MVIMMLRSSKRVVYLIMPTLWMWIQQKNWNSLEKISSSLGRRALTLTHQISNSLKRMINNHLYQVHVDSLDIKNTLKTNLKQKLIQLHLTFHYFLSIRTSPHLKRLIKPIVEIIILIKCLCMTSKSYNMNTIWHKQDSSVPHLPKK